MIDLGKNNFSKRELQESVMTRERIQTGIQAIFCRRRRQRRLRRESMWIMLMTLRRCVDWQHTKDLFGT